MLHRYLLTSSRESFSAGSRTDQGVILGRCYIPLTGVQSFEHFEYSLSWESTTFDFCCLQNTFPCIHLLNFENLSAMRKYHHIILRLADVPSWYVPLCGMIGYTNWFSLHFWLRAPTAPQLRFASRTSRVTHSTIPMFTWTSSTFLTLWWVFREFNNDPSTAVGWRK